MISVITITYNNLSGLDATCESVFSQSHKDYEWIIVDGGSNDGTVEFLLSLGENCDFTSEPDGGIYDAMQRGLFRSRGSHVIFLNAGDKFHDDRALARVSNVLGEEAVLFFDTLLVAPRSSFMRRARPLTAARYSVPAVQQSTVYKSDTLRSVRWPTGFSICGDYYIAAQLLAREVRWATVHTPLATFELGGVSTFRFLELAREAWIIQREVLALDLATRVCHAIRRLVFGSLTWVVFVLQSRRAIRG